MKRLLGSLLLPMAALAGTPVTVKPYAELVTGNEQRAPASVMAQNQPALAAEISARILELPAQVGDQLRAGELVARLDCRVYTAQTEAADARLRELQARQAFATSQLQRARNLKAKRNLSAETLEQRQSELDSLTAQVEAQQQTLVQSDIQVERCQVRAPFAAVVTARLASVGALASVGSPLIEVIQTDNREVRAELRDGEAQTLQEAQTIEFEYQGRAYPVTLRAVVPVVDARRRTREVRLTFTADAAPSGAAGRLIWHDGREHVPAALLVRRDGQLGVFRAEQDRAVFVPLPEAREGKPARLSQPPDTAIIDQGRQRIRDGDSIVIQTPSDTAG